MEDELVVVRRARRAAVPHGGAVLMHGGRRRRAIDETGNFLAMIVSHDAWTATFPLGMTPLQVQSEAPVCNLHGLAKVTWRLVRERCLDLLVLLVRIATSRLRKRCHERVATIGKSCEVWVRDSTKELPLLVRVASDDSLYYYFW